jgi:hypothetical protein
MTGKSAFLLIGNTLIRCQSEKEKAIGNYVNKVYQSL